MNIIRKIKLSYLGCYQINDLEKDLFDMIEQNFIGVKSYELFEYPNRYMYFNKNNKFIFSYYPINQEIYVSYKVWIDFNCHYTEDESLNLLKILIGKTFNLKIDKVLNSNNNFYKCVEKIFKDKYSKNNI